MTLFVLDTSVFIQAQRRHYPRDVFPGFWEMVVHYCGEGAFVSIDRAKDEIFKKNDALTNWAQTAPVELFVSSAVSEVVSVFADMQNWVQEKEHATQTDGAGKKVLHYNQNAISEFAKVADGWVAAYAKVVNGTLVTEEEPNAEMRRKVPLPNLCEEFSIPCIKTSDMLRELGIRFVWQEN